MGNSQHLPPPRQLPLSVGLTEAFTFDNYIAAANDEVVGHLKSLIAGQGERVLYLWGNTGVGKTHLLQASCALTNQRSGTVAYLPLADHASLDVSMLKDLDERSLVCLDDVHAVANDDEWARALFNFYNQAQAAGTQLIMSALTTPAGLPKRLPDLVSRLAANVCLRLNRATDRERQRALQRRADELGFEVSDDVAAYILQRAPRDMHFLFDLLHRIDSNTLTEQRRVTVPFVRNLLRAP